MTTMTTTRIAEWGNSAALRLNSTALRAANLQKGSQVIIEVVAEGLLIKPATPPRMARMKLADMLAACDTQAAMPSDLGGFTEAPVVGEELL